MSAPIYDKLNEINSKGIYPFCMPGHKRNPDYFPKDMYSYDYTEIDGTDILRSPSGIIADAQAEIADISGASSAFICVNGATGALQGSLLYALSPNDKVLVAANCHKSVFNALILCGAMPVFVYPNHTGYGFFGSISPKDIETAVGKYPDIKACIITSPTYEGIVSDVKSISDILHKRDILLIVDEAHGAYFSYFDFLPLSAAVCGADITVQSYHKTLPALGQTAVALCSERVDPESFNNSLSLTETSSPSYIFMSLADKIRETLINNKKISDNYCEKLNFLRCSLSVNRIFSLLQKENDFFDLDIGKIVITINADISGSEISRILVDEFKIQPESCGMRHIIFMTSPADSQNDFEGFARLANAFSVLENRYKYKQINLPEIKHEKISAPEMRMRDAFYAQKTSVPIDDAEGLICGENIYAYPPGIPILVCGSRITHDKTEYLKALKADGINIKGSDLITLKAVKLR